MDLHKVTRLGVQIISLISLVLVPVHSAYALSNSQSKAMYRHGIWEWSLKNCPDALRQKGYWYALKEVGGFHSIDHILSMENGPDFAQGWKYMSDNELRFGISRTCDYAFQQWPAVLYRREN